MKINGEWAYKNRYWIGGAVALATIGIVVYLNRKKISQAGTQVMQYAQNKVWDTVSERNIDTLHPLVRDKARIFINRVEKELGIRLRVVSALRTWAEQDELYAKGRTKAGAIVTNAKGGQSNHNFGTAIDVVPIENGVPNWKTTRWNDIAKIGKEVGFDWGGDWKSIVDKPHFEMNFGHSLAQMRDKYLKGDKDGNYIRLVA